MPPEEDTTLELRDYFRVLRRRKWIIMVTLVVCLGAAFAMSFTRTPIYEAQTKVLLETRLVDELFGVDGRKNSFDAERERANEIQIMSSPEVRAKVEEKLGRPPAHADFAPVEGSDVVQIVVESENAKQAAEDANAYAETYIEVRRDLEINDLNEASEEVLAQIAELDPQIASWDADLTANPPIPVTNANQRQDPRVTIRGRLQAQRDSYASQYERLQEAATIAQTGGARVLAAATTPTEARNRSPLSNLLAGLAIGIVLAVALALLREYLDDRIKTKEDLETASDQTVIGLVPLLGDWKNEESTELVSVTKPSSPAAEAYRTVRTSVEFLSLDQPIGSLQVTSAMSSEGKTTTLANLAVSFARVGQRVIVLCCDLRRPRIHQFFGMSNSVGFTSMLLGDAPASEAIQRVRGDLPLGLVASGPLAPNPAELLASKRAISVIEELDSQCDLLLIDSPPVLPVTDAQVISGLVDGVILVSSAGLSTKRDVRRAVELLHQVDAPLIGAILNRVQSKHESVYSYGDSRYYIPPADTTEPAKRNGRRSKKAPTRAAR